MLFTVFKAGRWKGVTAVFNMTEDFLQNAKLNLQTYNFLIDGWPVRQK